MSNPAPTPPPPLKKEGREDIPAGSQWLMTQLNRLDDRFDRLDDRFDRLDDRLRKIEYKVWFACGGVVVLLGILWFIGQAVLSSHTFNLTPKAGQPVSESAHSGSTRGNKGASVPETESLRGG